MPHKLNKLKLKYMDIFLGVLIRMMEKKKTSSERNQYYKSIIEKDSRIRQRAKQQLKTSSGEADDGCLIIAFGDQDDLIYLELNQNKSVQNLSRLHLMERDFAVLKKKKNKNPFSTQFNKILKKKKRKIVEKKKKNKKN